MAPSTRNYDDRELLTRLYVERGMTIAEIARELGATSVTIQKYLKKYEVPSRGRGPRKGRRGSRTQEAETREISEALRERLLRLVASARSADPSASATLLAELSETIRDA